MFTDGQLLLLLLWGLYLWECLVWHGRHALVFRSWFGKRWHLAGIDLGPGGMGKAGWEVAGQGGVCANPLWWGGQTVVGHLLPVSISPGRVVAGNLQTVYATGRPRQGHRAFSLDELTDMSVREEELWIGGTRFCRFPSAVLAREVHALLRELRNCPAERREEGIRAFWRGRFDRKAFQSVRERCQAAANRLQWGCMGLFLLLYVAAPVLAVLAGTGWAILLGGPLVFLTAFAVEWGAFRARRRLGIGTLADAIGEWIKGALCPPAAIRAADALFREMAPCFDPLTLAAELLPEDGPRSSDAAGFFARVSADLRHPLVCDGAWSDADRAAMEWQCTLVLDEALRAFPGQREALSGRVPSRIDSSMRAYCPRCGCQYASRIETCPDCPNVRLEKWSAENAGKTETAGKSRHRRQHARPRKWA